MIYFLLMFSVNATEFARVFGNAGLGYYYVDVWVGTPPNKQTLIVDTGSKLTAFPCTTCESCGRHTNPYFDYFASNSSKTVSCDEDYSCASCHGDRCEYSLSYAEGSSIDGLLIGDQFRIGDSEQNSFVSMVFGCHKRETNLFKSQVADGILGLSNSHENLPTIIDVLNSEHRVDSKSFRICFAHDGGFMSIGANYNETDYAWGNLYGDSYYSLNLTQITVGGERLNLQRHDFTWMYQTGTILDSGTSFVYFSRVVYDKVWQAISSFCDSWGNCGVDTHDDQAHVCFQYDFDRDLEEFYRTFPTIELLIDDEVIKWTPKDYLFTDSEFEGNYCIGIYNNANNGNILGGLFMRRKMIVIDQDNQRIGFADNECDPAQVEELKEFIHVDTVQEVIKEAEETMVLSDDDFFVLAVSSLIVVLLAGVCLLRLCKCRFNSYGPLELENVV